MVQKVHGAVYPGIWVEKQVVFIKLTFNIDISAIAATNLYELGTTTAVSSGTVADGTFGVVESVLVQALKQLEMNCTVLGMSTYNATNHTVDVMVGAQANYFSDTTGSIATGLTVPSPQAVITTAGSAAADAVGTLVSVNPAAVSFTMFFSYMDGTMTIATGTNGALVTGPGATNGTLPAANSPTGNAGFSPVELPTA
jgi:hypothetical protein